MALTGKNVPFGAPSSSRPSFFPLSGNFLGFAALRSSSGTFLPPINPSGFVAVAPAVDWGGGAGARSSEVVVRVGRASGAVAGAGGQGRGHNDGRVARFFAQPRLCPLSGQNRVLDEFLVARTHLCSL